MRFHDASAAPRPLRAPDLKQACAPGASSSNGSHLGGRATGLPAAIREENAATLDERLPRRPLPRRRR